MKFKKIISLLLCVCLCTCLIACNTTQDETNQTEQSPPSNEQTQNSTQSDVQTQQEPDKVLRPVDLPVEEEPAVETLQPDCSPDATTASSQFESLDSKVQGWGQGVNVDEFNRPVSCDGFQNKYGKYDAIFIGPKQKNITLTFDHGYENGYTPLILDTLKEKNCKAVMFVTYDYVSKNPELTKRMIDEGHILGNHTYKHKSQPKITLDEAKDEIMKLHDYVKENFGYEMTYFRAPMGEFSEQTLALAQSLGYKTIFWSFAYKDWIVDQQMGIDKAFPKVTEAVHDGAIYLLHPVSSDNANMLGDVIDHFVSQGYSVDLENIK